MKFSLLIGKAGMISFADVYFASIPFEESCDWSSQNFGNKSFYFTLLIWYVYSTCILKGPYFINEDNDLQNAAADSWCG